VAEESLQKEGQTNYEEYDRWETLRERTRENLELFFSKSFQRTKSDDFLKYKNSIEIIQNNQGINTSENLYEYDLSHFDIEQLNTFFSLDRVKKELINLQINPLDPPKIILKKLELLRNELLIKGTFLCFGRFEYISEVCQSASPSRFFVYRDKEGMEIGINEIVRGNIIQQYKTLTEHIMKNLYLIRNFSTRQEEYEIPKIVFYELVANALVHRDYDKEINTEVSVSIYPDRMEIINPGQFPQNINPMNHESITQSYIKHKQIAYIFFFYGIIESAAKGIKRVQKVLKDNGFIPAEFILKSNSVKVIVYKKSDKDKKLEKQKNEYSKNLNPIPHLILNQVVGRSEELGEIKDYLKIDNNSLSINGIGGIGKTTLAKAFVQQNQNEYEHIVWITAVPTLKDSMLSNIALINNLGMKEEISELITQKRENDAIDLLLNRISGILGNNLIILDNVSSEEEQLLFKISEYLQNNWKLILTSRHKLNKFFEYQLGFLLPEKSRELFLQNYNGECNPEILDELLKYIGYHTLTIELISKALKINKGLTLEEAFDLIKKHEFENKKLAVNVFTNHSEKEAKIYTHLFSLIDFMYLSDNEIWLLKQFCILPSTEIKMDFIAEITGSKNLAETEFYKNLNSLIKKGFLVEMGDYVISHQIIKEVALAKFIPELNNVRNIFNYFLEFFDYDQSKDNPVDKFMYIEYGLSILEFIEYKYKDENAIVDSTGILSLYLNRIGIILKEFGRYETARRSLERALKSDIKNFGEDNPNVTRSKSNLALVYYDLGKYEQAADLLEEALESDIKNFGEDHPAVAVSQSNLATVYQTLGKYEKAAALSEKTLESDIRNFGENDPNVTIRKSNLSSVYRDLGKYEQAADLLEKALESDIKNFGEDHPAVAASQSNLAAVYQALGKYEQAEELLEKALKSDIKNFGENHHNVARSQSSLALVYQDLGKYEQAAELLEKALKSDIKNFGKDHPNVTIRQSNLATVYRDLGKYEQAEELLGKALRSAIKNYGENHPNVAVSQSNLALVYQNLGKHEQAVELLEKSLESVIKNFGEDHPNVAISQSNLVLVYQDLGKYEQAKKLAEAAYNKFKKLLGKDHPNTKGAKRNLEFIKQQKK